MVTSGFVPRWPLGLAALFCQINHAKDGSFVVIRAVLAACAAATVSCLHMVHVGRLLMQRHAAQHPGQLGG